MRAEMGAHRTAPHSDVWPVARACLPSTLSATRYRPKSSALSANRPCCCSTNDVAQRAPPNSVIEFGVIDAGIKTVTWSYSGEST